MGLAVFDARAGFWCAPRQHDQSAVEVDFGPFQAGDLFAPAPVSINSLTIAEYGRRRGRSKFAPTQRRNDAVARRASTALLVAKTRLFSVMPSRINHMKKPDNEARTRFAQRPALRGDLAQQTASVRRSIDLREAMQRLSVHLQVPSNLDEAASFNRPAWRAMNLAATPRRQFQPCAAPPAARLRVLA